MILNIKSNEVIIDDEDFEKVKCYTWFLDTTGYVMCKYLNSKKILYMHRLILGVNHLSKKYKVFVDHINRNIRDNRKQNLRLVNQSLNNFNSRGKMGTKSKYKGVTFETSAHSKSYFAQIAFNGKQARVFLSKNEHECAYAYNCATKILKIEHAYQNTVQEEISEERKKQIIKDVALKLWGRRLINESKFRNVAIV